MSQQELQDVEAIVLSMGLEFLLSTIRPRLQLVSLSKRTNAEEVAEKPRVPSFIRPKAAPSPVHSSNAIKFQSSFSRDHIRKYDLDTAEDDSNAKHSGISTTFTAFSSETMNMKQRKPDCNIMGTRYFKDEYGRVVLSFDRIDPPSMHYELDRYGRYKLVESTSLQKSSAEVGSSKSFDSVQPQYASLKKSKSDVENYSKKNAQNQYYSSSSQSQGNPCRTNLKPGEMSQNQGSAFDQPPSAKMNVLFQRKSKFGPEFCVDQYGRVKLCHDAAVSERLNHSATNLTDLDIDELSTSFSSEKVESDEKKCFDVGTQHGQVYRKDSLGRKELVYPVERYKSDFSGDWNTKTLEHDRPQQKPSTQKMNFPNTKHSSVQCDLTEGNKVPSEVKMSLEKDPLGRSVLTFLDPQGNPVSNPCIQSEYLCLNSDKSKSSTGNKAGKQAQNSAEQSGGSPDNVCNTNSSQQDIMKSGSSTATQNSDNINENDISVYLNADLNYSHSLNKALF